MIFRSEIETMRSVSPVGGHFQEQSGQVYRIVSFEDDKFVLENASGEKFTAVVVVSGPHLDFYIDGVKHGGLSSSDAYYMRPREAASVRPPVFRHMAPRPPRGSASQS